MQETTIRLSSAQMRFNPWLNKAQSNAVLICALEEVFPEFDLNHLKGDGRFDEKGLSSIDIASLVCSIEDLFHFKVSDEEYQQFYTIEGARRVIAQKLLPSVELRGKPVRMGDVQPGWKTSVHHMVSKFHHQRDANLSR